jgi:hypothetical protein
VVGLALKVSRGGTAPVGAGQQRPNTPIPIAHRLITVALWASGRQRMLERQRPANICWTQAQITKGEMRMLQIIVAIVVAVWFYKSARAVGKNGFGWAVIGIVAMTIPSLAWGFFVRAAILPTLIRSQISDAGAIMSGLAIGLVGIGLGLAVVFWLHRTNLKSNAQPTTPASTPADG